MTVQKLHLDLIDFRKGTIDLDQLRALFPTWQVSKDYARFCVEIAQASPLNRKTGDLFA
jgi:hypothetical protein